MPLVVFVVAGGRFQTDGLPFAGEYRNFKPKVSGGR